MCGDQDAIHDVRREIVPVDRGEQHSGPHHQQPEEQAGYAEQRTYARQELLQQALWVIQGEAHNKGVQELPLPRLAALSLGT